MSGARTVLAAAMLAALLAGCASVTPAPPSAPSSPPVEQGLSVGERVTLAKELLNHNDRDKARAELEAALKTEPTNPAAVQLLREMDEDPAVALGSQSFDYTVRPGDSFTALAGRFLGDPLKFYALARYNGVAAPADIAVGQVLRIPGYPPPPRSPSSRPAPPSHKPTPAPVPAPVAASPAHIRALRASALENLNRGQINRAVNLLQDAARQDPNNALVKRDLARAERIQAAVNRK